MIENILTFIWIWIVAFLPILLWGYFFWYIDDDYFNKKRFGLGILAGGLSVFPVLYLGNIIEEFWLQAGNIFFQVHALETLSGIFGVFISFLILLFVFSLVPFLFFYLTPISKEKLKIYLQRFFIFSLYFILISFGFYLLHLAFENIGFLQKSTNVSLSFWEVVFNSFKLVVFYYLLIGILEELSKFLFFSYSKHFFITSVRQWVMYGIFIALGFAFIENILYFQSLFEKYGFGKELVSTFFLRNIFSVFLHILCSSIFAYYFSTLYLKYKNNYNFEFIKVMFFGFLFALLFHALFDIFLTFQVTIFIFFYIVWGYFYLTYILYKE